MGKKATLVFKPAVPAPKPIKRRIEPLEPQFVVVQPPVAPVATSEKASKNKAGLSQKELDVFRDMLLAKRRELVGDMSSMEREALREGNANLSNLPVHMADQGTDAYEQEFTLGLVEKDRSLLREINDALAKIQNGTYGICEGTGNPISRPRLEAQPWARHSIEYARILEKRQMSFRR
jgi:DnaK suppressor protein